MAQTKEGAIKAKQTILNKYGQDYFTNIGKSGGAVCSPKKGFGGNRELARKAGKLGGQRSKRNKTLAK